MTGEISARPESAREKAYDEKRRKTAKQKENAGQERNVRALVGGMSAGRHARWRIEEISAGQLPRRKSSAAGRRLRFRLLGMFGECVRHTKMLAPEETTRKARLS